MVREALTHLKLIPSARVIDATLGLGGHAEAILRDYPEVRVLGLDRDPEAIKLATQRLKPFGDRLQTRHGSFADLDSLAADFGPACGILMDLGISSWQLAERGFSFQTDAPLDMRMDPGVDAPAAELVNGLPEGELADFLYQYGEEHRSRRIAKAIVEARPVSTTQELAEVIATSVGRRGRLHPATKSFQALRIAVNDELGAIERTLPLAIDLLAPGGRLAVISFHSLEDRIVKDAFRLASTDCICPPKTPVCICGHVATTRILTKKPLTADEAEIASNPRSRSARLLFVNTCT